MGAAGGVSNRRSHWRSAPKMSVCPWWIEMSLWLDFAMTVLEAQRRLFTALAGLKVFVLESLAIRLMNLVACFPISPPVSKTIGKNSIAVRLEPMDFLYSAIFRRSMASAPTPGRRLLPPLRCVAPAGWVTAMSSRKFRLPSSRVRRMSISRGSAEGCNGVTFCSDRTVTLAVLPPKTPGSSSFHVSRSLLWRS